MTNQERVLAVVQRNEPDRVPTFEWDIDPRLIETMSVGGSYESFIEKYDLDAIMCGPDYIKRPLDNGRILDEWGVTRIVGHEAYAMPIDRLVPIRNMADLEQWDPPDPYAPERFDTMKRRIQRYKDQRAIFVQLRDVWSNPRDLMGYEELLVNCLTEPELVVALVDKCIDQSIALVELAAELGAEIVMSGDDIADNQRTLISPKVWNQIFLPPFRRWVQAIHDCGLYYWKHTDGNIMAVLESLVDAGIDGIDPIDPIAGMDLAVIKHEWGSQIAIKGNIDCAELLTNGVEADVVEAVKDCIRTAGPGGGFACSSSNSIHSGVKPELYSTMVNAIREYGIYPLDMDKLAPLRKKI